TVRGGRFGGERHEIRIGAGSEKAGDSSTDQEDRRHRFDDRGQREAARPRGGAREGRRDPGSSGGQADLGLRNVNPRNVLLKNISLKVFLPAERRRLHRPRGAGDRRPGASLLRRSAGPSAIARPGGRPRTATAPASRLRLSLTPGGAP